MATVVKILKKNAFNSQPILFTGLPGIGFVGKIVVDYLLKEFKGKKVAEIYSDSFPPSVHAKNGVIDLIKDEIFHIELNKQDFLFLSGPVQPSLDFQGGNAASHYEFAEKIVMACKELNVKEIYTLAGINIGEKRMNKDSEIVVAATSKPILDEWKKFKIQLIQDEGLISGAAGLILGIAREHGIEGACLMGETNARLVYGDHGAAKSLIELLMKKYGFKIKMEEIAKESKNIEEAFHQLQKQLDEEPEDKTDSLSYVR